MWVSLLAFCCLLALTSFLQGEDISHYHITKQRSDDVVTVEKEGGVTVFNVRSSNGIGWAKFTNDRAWPMKAFVRLQYQEDRAWEHLENFTLSSGRAFITIDRAGNFEVRPTSETGRDALGDLTPEQLREKLGLHLKQSESAIEIELPMNWLAEESEFTLRWIDVYRN